jgi:hypothetical protein
MRKKVLFTDEIEYWQFIQNLGMYIRNTLCDLSTGRINSTHDVQKNLSEATAFYDEMIGELYVLFGVIHPKSSPPQDKKNTVSAPPGMKWYWDWHNEMERITCEAEQCTSMVFLEACEGHVRLIEV